MAMIKNFRRLTPSPPSNLSVALMICPGVRVNSVRVTSAGFMIEAVKLMHTMCSELVRYRCGSSICGSLSLNAT